MLCVLIRRMNLDAFWSRARTTAEENTRRIKQTIKLTHIVGLHGPFEHIQSYPAYDHSGYEVTACKLLHSSQPGRHDPNYTQFETIRKHCMSFAHQAWANPTSALNSQTIVDCKRRYTQITNDKCGSLWFN